MEGKLRERFLDIVPASVKNLGKNFDLETCFERMASFTNLSGKLHVQPEDRKSWDEKGNAEFQDFYKHLCRLPHIDELQKNDSMLDLMPHCSTGVYRKYKSTLLSMVWKGLGGCTQNLFADENGKPVTKFGSDYLVKIESKQTASLDKWFDLTFSTGPAVTARIDEEFVFSVFYNNEEITKSLGRELCISLDVALTGSGCEAVVEGFYSVVGNHTKSGRQSNDVLTQRAIVDWCIPHPISSPSTMEEIAKIYTEGDSKFGLPKHRLPVYV